MSRLCYISHSRKFSVRNSDFPNRNENLKIATTTTIIVIIIIITTMHLESGKIYVNIFHSALQPNVKRTFMQQ